MENVNAKVPKRIASALINSLKGGVVPRIGLPYITVGRKNEIDALLHDTDIVEDGGAAFRFLVGRYGSGKSFLLQTIRAHVMERGFVVVDADLSPERRLQGTRGQGLATYRELLRNMSTKTRPEGGALSLILDRWISQVQADTMAQTGLSPEAPTFVMEVEKKIMDIVRQVNVLVHGFDFARLLQLYFQAYVRQDEETKAKVLKWFRGEYNTKKEAKDELGVSIIITDDDWYDYLKIFAFFLRQADYKGLVIMLDELVNLYKIPNTISRQYNYEKILTMYNDCLQGKAQYLSILMCCTPQCLEDRHRGIYSYEALRSRLAEGHFSREGARDLLAPVIRLEPLTPEEMLVLAGKLADIHSQLYGYEDHLSDADLADFIKIEFGRVGADSHITPREIIRDFIEILDILYQRPELTIQTIMRSDDFAFTRPEEPGAAQGDGPADLTGRRAGTAAANAGESKRSDDDDLAEFTL